MIDRIRRTNRRISADSLEDVASRAVGQSGREYADLYRGQGSRKGYHDSLKPEQRQVLQLSIVQGLSHQEIADATGMPLGTVKTHARRGILQARELMGLNKGVRSAGEATA